MSLSTLVCVPWDLVICVCVLVCVWARAHGHGLRRGQKRTLGLLELKSQVAVSLPMWVLENPNLRPTQVQ